MISRRYKNHVELCGDIRPYYKDPAKGWYYENLEGGLAEGHNYILFKLNVPTTMGPTGAKKTDWHMVNLKAWGKMANSLKNSIKMGDHVEVTAVIKNVIYFKNGRKCFLTNIEVTSYYIMRRRQHNMPVEGLSTEMDLGELPSQEEYKYEVELSSLMGYADNE